MSYSIKRSGLRFFKMTLLNNQVHLWKKSIIRFYFSAATANFWSLLNDLVWIFGIKSIKRPVLSFFSNSRSLERTGLIIESNCTIPSYQNLLTFGETFQKLYGMQIRPAEFEYFLWGLNIHIDAGPVYCPSPLEK